MQAASAYGGGRWYYIWLCLASFFAVGAPLAIQFYGQSASSGTTSSVTTQLSEIPIAVIDGYTAPVCGVQCVITSGCAGYSYDAGLRQCFLLRGTSNGTAGGPTVYKAITGQSFFPNVALNRNASISSLSGTSFIAKYLVDGITTTVARTNGTDPFPWMTIYLGDEYLVSAVNVTTRQECCGNRAHDFDIRVGHSGQPSATGFFGGSLCWHRSGSMAATAAPPEVYTCPTLLRGSYVTVQVTVDAADRYFNLAEIAVFAWSLN